MTREASRKSKTSPRSRPPSPDGRPVGCRCASCDLTRAGFPGECHHHRLVIGSESALRRFSFSAGVPLNSREPRKEPRRADGLEMLLSVVLKRSGVHQEQVWSTMGRVWSESKIKKKTKKTPTCKHLYTVKETHLSSDYSS